jgi:hypothetical protein
MELCAICEGGWVVATVWIDHEDLFMIPTELMGREVDYTKWDELTVRGKEKPDGRYGDTMRIPCRYIYLKSKV